MQDQASAPREDYMSAPEESSNLTSQLFQTVIILQEKITILEKEILELKNQNYSSAKRKIVDEELLRIYRISKVLGIKDIEKLIEAEKLIGIYNKSYFRFQNKDLLIGALANGDLSQIERLDLGVMTPDSKSAIALAKAISDDKLSNLKSLHLRFDCIGNSNAQVLAKAITSGKLLNLRLTGNDTDSDGINALIDTITNNSPSKLQNLMLSIPTGIGSKDIDALAKAIKDGYLPQLKKLDLSNSVISAADKEILNKAIENAKANEKLVKEFTFNF